MDTYYESLGLEPGASQAEIKKAYFKMVRQYSPESDPEQFQKIREAYEVLKDAENRPKGPEFPPFKEPAAKEMLRQIESYRSAGDMEECRDCCEEAHKKFPKELRFLYLLAGAQRQCGNTSKAVKSAKELVLAKPNNQWFQRELAIAYTERGYVKKAYETCTRAYDLGCRDIDFILMYSLACKSQYQYDRIEKILLEVIRQERRWSRDEIAELVEIYAGLFQTAEQIASNHLDEIAERFCLHLKQYGIYMKEYQEELYILMFCIRMCKGLEYQKAMQIFDIMRELFPKDWDEDFSEGMKQSYDYERIIEDSRICPALKHGYDAYMVHYLEEVDDYTEKFAWIDTQLCMIEEREEVLRQEEIIRNDYPDYYEQIKDFFQKLKEEKNIVYLKSKLQKIYRRMEPEFDGGYYYEMYPEEQRKAQGTLISDGTEDEPYVRGSKKIGRNDPCPCGSGKKYKHCCMNKK